MKMFLFPPSGGARKGGVVAGRGLYTLSIEEHGLETPPYTLPWEGIAQSHAFATS
jgi:hypothetical protein